MIHNKMILNKIKLIHFLMINNKNKIRMTINFKTTQLIKAIPQNSINPIPITFLIKRILTTNPITINQQKIKPSIMKPFLPINQTTTIQILIIILNIIIRKISLIKYTSLLQ
jgi:hypothetical protein